MKLRTFGASGRVTGSGHLVEVGDAEAGRRIVQAQEAVTGDAIASKRALCAVSVVALVPAANLNASHRGKRVFAVSGQEVSTTDNGKYCGVLLDVAGGTAAILLD